MNINGEVKAFLSWEQVEAIKKQWVAPGNAPESNWELYRDSLRSRSECLAPYVLSAYDGNRLLGMLGGRVERGDVVLRFGYWRLLRLPLQKIMIDFVQTLLPEDCEELLRRTVSKVVEDLLCRRADVAAFDFMPDDSTVHRFLQEIELPFGMKNSVSQRRIHWYLNLPTNFHEYQRNHKGLMQKVRKFETAYGGRHEYRLLSGSNEIDDFCASAEVVARSSYQRALHTGFLNSREDRGKIRAAAAQGSWLAFIALVEGRPVAFWSGCRFENNVFLWWTSYDRDYQEFSPGLVAFTRLVERLMGDGVTWIDFGGGDAPYKERLGNESRWERKLCIYAPTLRGMLAKGICGLDAALGNLIRTKLKGLANRLKSPWRRFMARKVSGHPA